MHLDLKEAVDLQYYECTYDKQEVEFLLNAHSGDGVFLDVGANIGFYSLAFARRFPSARVMAFEPDPYNVAKLRRNIAANGFRNITICEYALSDISETRSLNLNFAGNRGGNSLLLSQVPYTGKPERSIEVHCKTLLEALTENGVPEVSGMKIDIEGYEFPVLKTFLESAPKMLWPRAIVLEAFGHTIATAGGSAIQLLILAGYRLVNHTAFNFLFERPGSTQ